MKANSDNLSFGEHLDVLRAAVVKCMAVALVFSIAAFCCKDELFAVILAPKDPSFVTYRMLEAVSSWVVADRESMDFHVQIISTGLAEQFMTHMQTSFCAGILCASPYILYQLFRFVSPALYEDERKYVVRVVGGGYVMFALGVCVCYFLIFPLTFRFLGDYQVSTEVGNIGDPSVLYLCIAHHVVGHRSRV